jgi:hypothetical protein
MCSLIIVGATIYASIDLRDNSRQWLVVPDRMRCLRGVTGADMRSISRTPHQDFTPDADWQEASYGAGSLRGEIVKTKLVKPGGLPGPIDIYLILAGMLSPGARNAGPGRGFRRIAVSGYFRPPTSNVEDKASPWERHRRVSDRNHVCGLAA